MAMDSRRSLMLSQLTGFGKGKARTLVDPTDGFSEKSHS